MRYGCIGEHLKHSFSKEVHNLIADYDYLICELKPSEIDAFMKSANFSAINVTIPYKETVIPYLSYIDESARLIGAVNTIVNRDGKLYGYNTDFYGMSLLAKSADISFFDKKVLILGSGGTSKTAYAVATAEGAREVLKVSRSAKADAISYEDAYERHLDAEVIINTTPVGMFPKIFDTPIDISKFPRLCGVLDAVYNPLSTPLILKAKELGIACAGGLLMLVAQAVKASEIFIDKKFPEELVFDIFEKIEKSKKNIVLIGMPSSGKTTVGRIIADKLGRDFCDTDEEITKSERKSIAEIFENEGEAGFRIIESEKIKEISTNGGMVIATGGGAVLNEANIYALRENGRIYFIDRPLSALTPTSDRPTASTPEDIEKRYRERYGLYISSAEKTINASLCPEDVAEIIINDFLS